jgi:hypothetical protein
MVTAFFYLCVLCGVAVHGLKLEIRNWKFGLHAFVLFQFVGWVEHYQNPTDIVGVHPANPTSMAHN